MSSRDIWGPLVWKLLHAMADLSNRRDVYLLWNQVLRATATILPCELCRVHMNEYIRAHPFVLKNWMALSPQIIRENIRRWINDFHNSVNERLGKPIHELKPLTDNNYHEKVVEVDASFRTLLEMWATRKISLREWRLTTTHLIGFLKGGGEPTA
jgi:hypothetical protein